MAEQTCQRPGGLALTRLFLERYPLPPGARALDVGCGSGATVIFLRGEHGLDAKGIDNDREAVADKEHLIYGDAAALPFSNNAMDALFFECSLSRMERPAAALREARRVLKEDGALFLSDLYAAGKPAVFSGAAGRVEALSIWESLFDKAELEIVEMQLHPEVLASYWGQLIFEMGPDDASGFLGGETDALKEAKCGYFSAILKPAQKAKCATRSPLDAWVWNQTGLTSAPDPESLTRWQMEQAVKTIETARGNSPFYREHLAGVNTDRILKENSLTGVPFTDGATLSREGMRMLCTDIGSVARVRSMPTSGSTGAPKRVWFTQEDLARTADFFAVGMSQIAPSGKPVAIMMSDDKPGSIASLLREGLARIGVDSVIHGGIRDLQNAYEAAAGAGCLVGVPAEIFYLCRKYPLLRPGGVLLSADYIPPAALRAISETWECPVYTHYGLTETCYGLAVQCGAREGQHLRAADYLVEIISPDSEQRLPPGIEGEIVLTSLQPRALPLVRYRTGDMGSLLAEPCTCGSTFPRLGMVRGRLENLRNSVPIHRLDDVLYGEPGLAGYYPYWKDNTLHLVMEGAVPDPTLLSHRLGCEVTVEQGEAPPWLMQGKRKL